jgi:hypothetical protein
MRLAPLWLAALAACAHGNSGSPDASGGGADSPAGTDSADPGCDGMPCDAVYVSKSGNDNESGTKTDPVKSIGAGIAKAAAHTPPSAVYVQSGEYDETVTMKPGVDVYGGFDTSWMPSSAATEIVGPSTGAVIIDHIMVATALHNVTVKSGGATTPGASSIAVLVTSSKSITLDTVIVQPGAGASGMDGVDGASGPNGGNGGNGQAGTETSGGVFCDGSNPPGAGAAGASACNPVGGGGGAAGIGGGAGGGGLGGVMGRRHNAAATIDGFHG